MYRMKQSPLNFFIHLRDGLFECGFTQLKLDPCLFLNGKVVCLIYVDDCLFYAVNEKYITNVINDLKAPGKKEHTKFLLDEEEDVAGFLGIMFNKHNDKK